MGLLNIEESILVVVDVQERLAAALEKDTVIKKSAKLVSAARALGIPAIVSEQYPQGLGATVPLVKLNLPENTQYIEKTNFSLYQEAGFAEMLSASGKKQVVLCGIETHICVYQTAVDLIQAGYEVVVVKDACASRNKYEFKMGIEAMEKAQARISCLEMVLFEWLRSSKHPKFKEIQALIK